MPKIPPPNYSQVPNILLDNMHLLSESELRVVLAVCRFTFGWHKERAVLSISFLCKATGMSQPGVISGTKKLVERGLLEKKQDGLSHSYSLTVGERQEVPPLIQGEGSGSKPLTQGETPPLTQGEIKKERGANKEGERKGAPLPLAIPTLGAPLKPKELPPEARMWNNRCGHLRKCLCMNETRTKHLRARRLDPFWADNFEAVLAKVASSSFCSGKNDRGWVADFDWLLQPNVAAKVMEGKYDNKAQSHSNGRLRGDALARSFRL